MTSSNSAPSVRSPTGLPVSVHVMPHDSIDTAVIAAIVLAAFLFALWFFTAFRAGGGVPGFYQSEFGPGVMMACGRGFVNPRLDAAPALQAFLSTRADRFTCDTLPRLIPEMKLTYFQEAHRYLIASAGLVWRAVGIGWRHLDALAAMFFAVALGAGYVALRFVCGRLLSVLVIFAWAVSPLHLAILPNLRDYSKAPYFALLLVATGIAFLERRPWRLVGLGIVFGAVQALGFGMRTDVLLNIVPFMVVLFAAAPDGMLGNLRAKFGCAAAVVVTFMVVALPVLRSYQSGNNMWHVALLGLTTPFDRNLGIRPAPYDFGYAYRDRYVEARVSSYWTQGHPASLPVEIGSVAYDSACWEYYRAILRDFPADIVSRAFASSLRLLNARLEVEPGQLGVTHPLLYRVMGRRVSAMEWYRGWGCLALFTLVVLIGAERLRYALVASSLVF